MNIKKLEIRNFGKLHNKTLEFSEGIHVITGENESGKSTVHTFIRSMLFGMQRLRGRAARNDTYSRYEPWENPAYYAGEMIFESGGKEFRLTRNFGRGMTDVQLVCLTDGEVLSVEDGDLSMLLGGISETVYDNTASVGQLKGWTDEGLVEELRNYMANYQGSSDGELDVAAALEQLNKKRKVLEQRQREVLEGKTKKKEELETKIQVFEEECSRLAEGLQQDKEERKREIYQKEVSRERIRNVKKQSRRSRKWSFACAAIAGLLLVLCVLQFFKVSSMLTRTGLGLASAGLIYLAYRILNYHRLEENPVVVEPEEQTLRRWQWNIDQKERELRQKQTALSNLQGEYEDLCRQIAEQDEFQEEIAAVQLAAETIRQLSSQMQGKIGGKLKKRMSEILYTLTEGRYLQVSMDEKLQIGLHTEKEYIPVEKVSRGAIEQAYFALRMAAMDILCGEEELPVLLDEAFVLYDEKRLKQALQWLEENRSQVLIFTCQKREEQALQELGIPYHKIVL